MPDKGGRVWSRLESAHFDLYTDLDASDSGDIIRMFERLLDGYYQLGWEGHGELPVKLHAVVFSDRSDFEVFAGDDLAGYYVGLTPFEPLIVMPAPGRLDGFQTLKHELTHYIALQSLPFQPRWFGEGIATYFQTAHFDRGGQFVVGEVPHDMLRTLRALGLVHTHKLMSPEATVSRAGFYATSWLLVHYLMSNRADAFVKYQDGLAQGLGHDAAWAAAFPDLQFERLDDLLHRYYQEGVYAYFVRPVPPYAGPPPRVSVLSHAEVYALRAQLWNSCNDCGSDAARNANENVAQALKLDPSNLRAAVMRIRSEPRDRRLAMAKAVTQAHPDAVISWLLLGSTELANTKPRRCTPETTAQLRQLGQSSAHALMLTAVCQAAAGEKSDAVELSARALRQQPADSVLLLMQAGVLGAVQDCDGLEHVLLQLRNAEHAPISTQKLPELESKCRSARSAH